jgi:prepilin-type N-terminal cleavage/methylation domain-containing protein
LQLPPPDALERNYNKGFTLAEVLIALVVIGVIAVITVQVLFAQVQKKSLESAFKKHYSELSQITKGLPIETGDCNNINSAQMKSYIISKLNVMKMQKITSNTSSPYFTDYKQYTFQGNVANKTLHNNCLVGNSNWVSDWGTAYKLILTDGAYIGVCSHSSESNDSYNRDSGVFISIDVNGDKKPNRFGYDIWNFHVAAKTCQIEGAGTYRSYLTSEDGYGSNSANASWITDCNKTSTSDSSGYSCAAYAIKNQSPTNSSKGYFDSL